MVYQNSEQKYPQYRGPRRAMAKCFCKEMQLIFLARDRPIVLIVFESGLVIISKCKLLRSIYEPLTLEPSMHRFLGWDIREHSHLRFSHYFRFTHTWAKHAPFSGLRNPWALCPGPWSIEGTTFASQKGQKISSSKSGVVWNTELKWLIEWWLNQSLMTAVPK